MKSPFEEEHKDEEFSISDAIDHSILMHRDVHFGGKFPLMIEYYQKDGKGIYPDFEIARIQKLEEIERNLEQNLAGMLLTGAEAERVAQAKEAYEKLKDLYDPKLNNDAAAQYPRLLADLILSEEEEPENEISAIVAEKKAIVPALMELVRAEDFYDPLFPGYGLAPALAAKCLGRIGDKRAITVLFEAIGESDIAFEDLALNALKNIGEPAKEFLMKVLHGRPITYDNERAAICLLQFKDDPEVASICLSILKELDLKQHMVFATYLILACEGLSNEALRKDFIKISNGSNVPKMLQRDFQTIIQHWKSV